MHVIPRLTRDLLARVRGQDGAPLELQGDGSLGGGIPRQGGGFTGLEGVTILGDIEAVVVVGGGGGQSREAAQSQVDEGTHLGRNSQTSKVARISQVTRLIYRAGHPRKP